MGLLVVGFGSPDGPIESSSGDFDWATGHGEQVGTGARLSQRPFHSGHHLCRPCGRHREMPYTGASFQASPHHQNHLAGLRASLRWHFANFLTASIPILTGQDILENEITVPKTYTLREIHMYTMVVNQDTLHLEVGLFAVLLVLKFDERVL